MDEKELEMLDKALRKAMIHFREKFAREKVRIIFCCVAGSFCTLIHSPRAR